VKRWATVLALIVLLGGCSPGNGAATTTTSVPAPPTPVAAEVLQAVIEFRVAPSGDVLGYRIVSARGGTPEQWEHTAKSAIAALERRRLTMNGDFVNGAIVTIYLTGESGPDPGKRYLRTSFRVAPAE
jgi:hypothetical protein